VSQIKALSQSDSDSKADSGDAVLANLNWRLYKTLKLKSETGNKK